MMNRLQELRKARGLTQEALASHMGVRQAAVSAHENGVCGMSLTTALAYAAFFGVTVDHLLSLPTQGNAA